MAPRARAFKCKVTHPVTGKVLRISARTRRELEAMRDHVDSIRNRLRLGTTTEAEASRVLYRLRRVGSKTLEQAARSYLARRSLSSNTKRRTQSLLSTHLAPLAPLALEELEAPRLASWIEELARVLTTSTVRMVWNTLRGIIRHALERGMVDRCPWGTWRPERIRGKVSDRAPHEAARHVGELLELIQVAYALDADGGNRGPKIAAAALLGLRQGELAGLRWSDVDRAAGTVTIRRGADGPTKGRRVDVLLADRALFNALAMWQGELVRADLYDAHGPVFPCPWRSSAGAPKPYRDRSEVLTTRELREVVRRAGLPNPERWTPHSLRATFVTLEAQGADAGDLPALRERTRHASIHTLVRYLRARTRELAPPRMLLGIPTPAPALPPSRKPVG